MNVTSSSKRVGIALSVLLSCGIATACGSGEDSAPVESPPVVEAPTSTDIATDATTVAPTDPPANDPTTVPPTEPPATELPPTVPPTDAPPATEPPTTGYEELGGYGPPTVDLELTDDRTSPVVEPLADGVYYAQDAVSDGEAVNFELGQWFACDGSGVPDHPEVECVSGFGTLLEPSTTVTMSPNAVVTVITGDLSNFDRADISTTEYARLLAGESPAADAPVGYEFTNTHTFVQVTGGAVVAVQQLYTS
ncbi:hypothetical protein [Ilumatobacter coccineus]|uniref:Lipoprotein n=1 Tax=Ilumatobacter coccineus (strain NBRC 103263 / KCTC 29153 / YM16-304) TaxID=1313172 RepID=A0A6C7E3J3_ILUCY|nr:hypothetical protein [Ilumatobacter coccineus]BAN01233.1 hypothetical protein YM304_09190 [Ilumatobacter coccineus YM16-304]